MGLVTVNMRSPPSIVTWYDGVKSQNSIYAAWLHASKHGVVELASIGDTPDASSCNTAVCSLTLVSPNDRHRV